MYISEPVSKLIRAARAVAFLHFGVAAVRLVGLFAIVISYEKNISIAAVCVSLLILIADYILPGFLLLFFGSRIARGAVWAAYAITTLAFLELSSMFLIVLLSSRDAIPMALTIACIVPLALVVKIPVLYLAAISLGALPELKHLRRSSSRQYGTGGFPVITQTVAQRQPTMATVKTPPPPTLLRSPRAR